MTRNELEKLTRNELRKVANQNGIPSKIYIGLSKLELIEAILNPESITTESQSTNPDSLADMLANALKGKVTANIDREEIENIITEKIEEVKETFQPEFKQIEIKLFEKDETKKVGLTHKNFQKVLEFVSDELNLWLYGEAGSGKTFIAKQVADTLELPFYSQSVTVQTTKSDLFGFISANGDYTESLFYKAYTEGGLFCLDEVDNGNANVLNVLNQATSSDKCAFPNGMKTKHKNFRLIACANTVGDGANRQYIGRNALDSALKDRFVFLEFNTDWDLAKAIALQSNPKKEVEEILELIHKMNLTVKKQNIKNVIITPRALFNGLKLKRRGLLTHEILEMTIFKGCDESTKSKLQVA